MSQETSNHEIDDLVKLSFFTEIGKAITSANTVNQTMQAVMDQIGKIFAPTYWSLLLRDSKTGELKFTIVVGSGVEQLKGRVLPRGNGIAGWIAEKGQSLIVENVQKDSRFNPQIDQETNFKTNSIIGVPLKSRGRVFGVIELINKIDGSQFTPFELSILQTIADYAAIAIEKAYYFKALKHIASIDSLTGLYNRRTFFRYLENEIARVKRSKGTFALMMIDIDHFKQINDRLGHTAGDQVLLKLSALLNEITRSSDTVCRFGGDEFIVLLPNSTDKDAEILKKRVETGLSRCNSGVGTTPIQVSFGIHMADGENADSAIAFVDKDMYRDKDAKKGFSAERRIEDIAEHTGNLINEEEL